MRQSNDQYAFILNAVDDAVWKPAQQATAKLGTEGMPGAGEATDPIDCRDRLRKKSIAESRLLLVVVDDRIVQLALRDREDPDVHLVRYFASTSSSDSALISPRR